MVVTIPTASTPSARASFAAMPEIDGTGAPGGGGKPDASCPPVKAWCAPGGARAQAGRGSGHGCPAPSPDPRALLATAKGDACTGSGCDIVGCVDIGAGTGIDVVEDIGTDDGASCGGGAFKACRRASVAAAWGERLWSLCQNVHPAGALGQSAGGAHPAFGSQSAGGDGQFGGDVNRAPGRRPFSHALLAVSDTCIPRRGVHSMHSTDHASMSDRGAISMG